MARAKYEYWTTEDGRTLLEGWARDGLTDDQLAKKMGISRSTLAEWRKKYPDISDTIKKGKELVDTKVENALLKRALGYDFVEKKHEESDKDGVKDTTIHRHIPPDVGAAAFWLKNRRPDKWRDKPDVPSDPESLKKAKELLGEIPSAID